MAKCMMHIRFGNVKRVNNQKAKQMHQSGDWKYISKTDFQRHLNNNQSNDKENN